MMHSAAFVVPASARDVPLRSTLKHVRAFNVTLIHPTGYVHARALDDAVAYLVAMLGAAGAIARRSTNHVDPDAINVIACPHLLDDGARIPAGAILFNSELAREWRPAYRERLARAHVWDYSHANLPHLPHADASAIPFGYCAELARVEPRRVPGPGDGLVFYGSMTPRRVKLLDALRAAGVRLDVAFGEYGTQREARLARAVAVLNLHKTDDDALFEPIRCFHALTRDVPVIAEDTTDPTAATFRHASPCGPRADFIAGVARAVADRAALAAGPPRFRATAQPAIDAIRDAIARYVG